MPKLGPGEAYCMTCRKAVSIWNGREVTLANGATAIQGTDAKGHKVTRITGRAQAGEAEAPEGEVGNVGSFTSSRNSPWGGGW